MADEETRPSIDDMCREKKKGHACHLEKDHPYSFHECVCKERWEEVKT